MPFICGAFSWGSERDIWRVYGSARRARKIRFSALFRAFGEILFFGIGNDDGEILELIFLGFFHKTLILEAFVHAGFFFDIWVLILFFVEILFFFFGEIFHLIFIFYGNFEVY